MRDQNNDVTMHGSLFGGISLPISRPAPGARQQDLATVRSPARWRLPPATTEEQLRRTIFHFADVADVFLDTNSTARSSGKYGRDRPRSTIDPVSRGARPEVGSIRVSIKRQVLGGPDDEVGAGDAPPQVADAWQSPGQMTRWRWSSHHAWWNARIAIGNGNATAVGQLGRSASSQKAAVGTADHLPARRAGSDIESFATAPGLRARNPKRIQAGSNFPLFVDSTFG
jgi:hypothetical protein